MKDKIKIFSNLFNKAACKYDYELGRFTSIDPLWEKYYEWTPYQYSACNPLRFYDDGGDVVKAMDLRSRGMIKKSVEKKYRHLIRFRDDGTAYLTERPKIAPMMKNLNNYTNIGALEYLVNSKDVIEVNYKDEVSMVTKLGLGSINLANGWGNNPGNWPNGISLVEGSSGHTPSSTKENTNEIFISSKQGYGINGKKASYNSTTAHELLGHIFLYIFGKEFENTPTHKGHEGKTGEIIKEAESNQQGVPSKRKK